MRRKLVVPIAAAAALGLAGTAGAIVQGKVLKAGPDDVVRITGTALECEVPGSGQAIVCGFERGGDYIAGTYVMSLGTGGVVVRLARKGEQPREVLVRQHPAGPQPAR